MKKLTLQLLALIIVFAVGGCGLNKMVDNADQVKYKVNPDPLEMHAKSVPLEISVTFPAKYFNKKAYLVITPFLVAKEGDNKIQFGSQTLQGEKVKDNNTVIPYKTGGSYTYRDTIAYEDLYRMSDLELHVSANKGGNGDSYDFANVKVALGIITTPELVCKGLIVDNGSLGNTDKGLMKSMTPTVELPQSATNKKNLVLYYGLQKDNLAGNEKNKDEVDEFLNMVKDLKADGTVDFQDVTIASYASPDGPTDLNHNLVQGRGDNSSKFLSAKLKRNDVADADDFLKRSTTPDEDWEGFKKAVEQSNLDDKDVILRVLSMYSDPDVREKEIKNMAAVYDELRNDILPKLRRSEIIATYVSKQRTPAELISLGKTDPTSLTQIELFYAATVAEDTDKETLYKSYIAQYPDDWKAFNNLGVYYIKNNQLDDAAIQLKKADVAAKQNIVSVVNNFGVLKWAQGDQESAINYFKKASDLGATDETNYNLGVICILNGKYQDAISKFGASSTYNKALAQVVAGNTADAQGTLGNIQSENAYYFYLAAVVSAKKDDANAVFTNLRKAIDKDATLKDYAANDLEFRNYFEDETFKSIIQ